MTILIAILILVSCFKRPMLGLALMFQINIIRSLHGIDFNEPCFRCINESDLILGAITPILGFMLIVYRFELIKSVKYVIDAFDVFFVFTLLVLFFTSIYAYSPIESLDYSFRFLILGYGYFFISKLIILNAQNHRNYFNSFLMYSYWIAIVLGIFGGVLYILKGFGQGAYRMTIPGVHPIPFSQLLGLGIFVSFLIFITNGAFFNIKSKFTLNLNKLILPILVLLLLATNTRGVMLTTGVAIFLYFFLSRAKINKRILYISGSLIVLAVIVAIQFIDFEVLFQRLLAPQTAASVDNRFVAYTDSFYIFLEHPFGIGPNAFQHYSILPYAHNIFLELLAEYGIFGIFLSGFLLFLISYIFLVSYKNKNKDLYFVIITCLFLYFFIETLVSFTLWMHRGMYIFMGLFAGFLYRYKKEKQSASL